MSPERERRFYEGWPNADGRRDRPLAEMRGPRTVERIKADVMRLAELRRAAKARVHPDA